MGFFGELDAFTNLWTKIKAFFKKDKLQKQCDDFYYEEFNKKIYVRKNGDGLIVSSFILKIIDSSKTTHLVRTLDIRDAKRDTKFPDFSLMRQCPIEKAFTEYGFWFVSDNDIITDVEEFYDEIDITKQTDDKYISIKFNLDTASLVAGKSYKFAYAYSIPGLFPISDGRFDVENADRSQYPNFNSFVSTKDVGHHLRFSAYFEEGIQFKEKPIGVAIRYKSSKKGKKETKYSCNYKNNIFYKKYCFEVTSPQEYEYIRLTWNLKNPY